jgi:hypothetical protein
VDFGNTSLKVDELLNVLNFIAIFFENGRFHYSIQAITPDLCIAKMHTAVQKSRVSKNEKGEIHINHEQL